MKYKVLDRNNWVLIEKEQIKSKSGLWNDSYYARVISSPNGELDGKLIVYHEDKILPYKQWFILEYRNILMLVEESE